MNVTFINSLQADFFELDFACDWRHREVCVCKCPKLLSADNWSSLCGPQTPEWEVLGGHVCLQTPHILDVQIANFSKKVKRTHLNVIHIILFTCITFFSMSKLRSQKRTVLTSPHILTLILKIPLYLMYIYEYIPESNKDSL